MNKNFVLLLCLAAAPLWAQMNHDAMPMEHTSPSQAPLPEPALPEAPPPDLLKDVTGRPPLKLDYFLSLADSSNPTLQQAAANIRRAEALAKQAALYPNPTAGYQGEQIRGGSYGGGEQGGFVEQTIVLGGKLGLRRDIYEQQKQADTLAAEAQRMRVHSEVTQMFYDALSAQQTVVVRAHLLHIANDAAQTARQLTNVGQADAPDVLEAEVEAEQASLDYTVAQRLFLQKFEQLAVLAGNPSVPAAPLDASLDTLPEIDASQLVDSIAEQGPGVKLAQQQVAIAEARWKAARREAVPDLQLKAGEQQNFEALANLPARHTGAQSFASAGIELPLWNRNQGNTRAAEASLDQARQEVTRTQLVLRSKAEMLAQNYLSARQEAERYRTALLPRARRAYELYLEKYQAGAQAYPQVIVSQRTLFELEVHYIDALDRTWQNAIALQNFTLQGALERPAASE